MKNKGKLLAGFVLLVLVVVLVSYKFVRNEDFKKNGEAMVVASCEKSYLVRDFKITTVEGKEFRLYGRKLNCLNREGSTIYVKDGKVLLSWFRTASIKED